METFTYALVVTGIIVGMGITRILGCAADLIVERNRVRLYWPHFAWLFLLFLVLIQYWFNLYGWRNKTYDFAPFISSLVFPLGAYLASAIIAAPLPLDGRVDLKEFYFSHSKWFFSITAVSMLYLIFHDTVILDFPLLALQNYFRAATVSILVLLAVCSVERLHKLGLITLICLFVGFVVSDPYAAMR